MSFSQQLPSPSVDAVRFLRKRGSRKAAREAGLRSRCPASGAEEFTALLMLTLYFSPQLLLCSRVSLLCCVSQRPRTQNASTFQCLVRCYYSESPISELREYFGSLAGCIDVMSSSVVAASSGGFVPGGAKVCAAAIHPGGRHKPEPTHSAACALVLIADLGTGGGGLTAPCSLTLPS